MQIRDTVPPSATGRRRGTVSLEAARCRRKFLNIFPKGFSDPKYLAWERQYKWNAHEQWERDLNRNEFSRLLEYGKFSEIAGSAVRIESRTNLLFSFEKMALRDAVKSTSGAEAFSRGLYDFLHGRGNLQSRFEAWINVVRELPRKQTRVLTWPLVTVFGFIARPDQHIFLKPKVTREAAAEYGFNFEYHTAPGWNTYSSLIQFGEKIKLDVGDLHPRDWMDIQSFIWVMGSDEYAEPK